MCAYEREFLSCRLISSFVSIRLVGYFLWRCFSTARSVVTYENLGKRVREGKI